MPVKKKAAPVKSPAGPKRVSKAKTASSAKKAATKNVTVKKVPAKKVLKKKTVSEKRVTPRMCEAVVDDDDEVAKAARVQARRRETLFKQRLAVIDRKRSAAERLDDPPPAPLPTLLARVNRAIERELTQIEVIIGTPHVPLRQRTEGERRARVLASLARTLREVMQLRRSEEKAREDDESVPRDLDELRDRLARRLDELVADAKAAHPGEADGR